MIVFPFIAAALLAAGVPIYTPFPPGSTNVYVATTGSDSTGNGTSGAPFASVAKAEQAVWVFGLNKSQAADVNVWIGPGDYWNTSLALDGKDSGSNGFNVHYRATNGPNTVRLLGATKLDTTTCTISSGSIYKCPVAQPASGLWTMYENGVRGLLARDPNLTVNASYPQAWAFYHVVPTSTGTFATMIYNSADFNPASWVVSDISINVDTGVSQRSWWNDIMPVTSLNTGTQTFTFKYHDRYGAAINQRYIVEGVLDILDQAGEWYYDRTDAHGAPGGQNVHYLYYWPRNTPITSQEIAVPSVTDVITIKGVDSSHLASHIALDGFTVEYSDMSSWYRQGEWGNSLSDNPGAGAGHADPSYVFDGQTYPDFRHANVYMTNVDSITIENVESMDAGLNGFMCFGPCTNGTVTNTASYHSGMNGFLWEGGYPGEGDVNKTHTFSNVRAQYMGELVRQGAGLWLNCVDGMNVSHFEALNGLRDGIFAQCPGAVGPFYTDNLTVDRVYMNMLGQDSGDMGAFGVYGLGSPSGGPYKTVNVSNMIIDTVAASPTMGDIAPNCVFNDQQTYGGSYSNIWCRVNNTHRDNASGEHTFTNVSWVGGFDSTLLPSDCGVTNTFPY